MGTLGRWAVALLLLLASPSGLGAGSLSAEQHGIRVELVSEPREPVSNRETVYTLTLTDLKGQPVSQAKATLAGQMADGMAVLTPLRATDKAGVYAGRVLFTMEGPWRMTLRVTYQEQTFELGLSERVSR
jgi:hypothetical protein